MRLSRRSSWRICCAGSRVEGPLADLMFTMSSTGKSVGKQARGTRARSVARKLAMQALYQWQLTQQSAAEIKQQFLESEDSAGVNREHFEELVSGGIAGHEALEAALRPFLDRPLDQLDPVETAILMIGMFELGRAV